MEICYLIYSSFEFIDWKTDQLKNNGYKYLGYSSGNDEKEAKLKFLESLNNNHPKDDRLEKMIY